MVLGSAAIAETPYKTYTVDGYGYVLETQSAYNPLSAITKVGETSFVTPMDLAIGNDGNLYIADSGAHAVLVSTVGGDEVRIIGEGTLQAPTGVFVSEDDKVYVADRDAKKVFVFDTQGTLLNEYGRPDSPIYGNSMDFRPLKVVANSSGTMYIICEGNIVFLDDPLSKWLGKGTIGGVIPMQALILVGMTALAHLLLTRTRMGTYTYAIGGNEEAGRYAGVDIDKYKILVFSFAGICTGVASCMMVTQVSMISPTIGSTTLMDAIAAAVIGGTSTLGGKGSAFGTLIGALIIGVISNALILLYVPTNAQYLVKGMIIISALYLNQLMNVGEK